MKNKIAALLLCGLLNQNTSPNLKGIAPYKSIRLGTSTRPYAYLLPTAEYKIQTIKDYPYEQPTDKAAPNASIHCTRNDAGFAAVLRM